MENRKLELADIAMYLPYRLKVVKDGQNIIYHIVGLEPYSSGVHLNGEGWHMASRICNIKPILRPMSDLTKPMTHPDVNGGEEFVPIDLFIPTLGCIVEVNYINGRELQIFIKTDLSTIMNIHYLSISDFKLLAKLHFDYQNLIDQGLAIDINTL